MFNLTASGNLTQDASVREVQSQNGTIYAIQFTVAINEKYGNKENATFLPCTYWVKSSKIAEFLKKGTAVIIMADWYSNNKHEERYYQDFRVRKIDFQRGKSSSEPPLSTPPAGVTTEKHVKAEMESEKSFNPFAEDEEDDLPF